MVRKIIIPLLSVLGLTAAIYTVRASNKTVTPQPPIAPPAVAPFERYVAGAGLVEASTENIAVGTLVPGVVTELYVRIGDRVKKGDALFKIDARDLDAELLVARASLESAVKQLERLRQAPRAEDVPPVEARMRAAEALRSNRQREFDRLSSLGTTVSRDEMDRALWTLRQAEAEAEAARAELDRVKAGTWQPDLDVAIAVVAGAQAQLDAVQVELDRRTVRSKIDGVVMQVKIREGEYASTGPLQQPLMLLGETETLHVRVDIDENDAWRVKDGAAARAFVRGNSELDAALTFVRIEPYIIPKRSLTGESSERVDTRVLQVIYAFRAADFEKAHGAKVYAGQQMDVFVESR